MDEVIFKKRPDGQWQFKITDELDNELTIKIGETKSYWCIEIIFCEPEHPDPEIDQIPHNIFQTGIKSLEETVIVSKKRLTEIYHFEKADIALQVSKVQWKFPIEL